MNKIKENYKMELSENRLTCKYVTNMHTKKITCTFFQYGKLLLPQIHALSLEKRNITNALCENNLFKSKIMVLPAWLAEFDRKVLKTQVTAQKKKKTPCKGDYPFLTHLRVMTMYILVLSFRKISGILLRDT